MTGSERFWAFVSEALAASGRSVVVDASGAEFIDSTGSMAIVRARAAATEVGVGFHVTSSSEALRRIARILRDDFLSGIDPANAGAGV